MPGDRRRGWVRRLFRRAVQIVLGLVALLVLVLAGFRTRSYFRETEHLRVPPRPGSFVRTPEGEFRYQERGGQGGRPVLIVGGTMAPSDTFLPLMEELCDGRLHCLAIDLPPFGYSERPQDGNYSRERQAARIVSVIRELRLQGTVLVGHSFGAGPAVETAMRYPGVVRTFALLAGALGLDSASPSRLVRAVLAVPPLRTAMSSATFANPWAIRASLRSFVENDSMVTVELVGGFTAPTRVEGMAQATGRWAQTAFFTNESDSQSGQRSSYRQYKRDVLLVWGDKDVATPLAQAEELKQLLPSCSLTVIPGANHFPHIEAQSRVVAALRPFLLAQRADAENE